MRREKVRGDAITEHKHDRMSISGRLVTHRVTSRPEIGIHSTLCLQTRFQSTKSTPSLQ